MAKVKKYKQDNYENVFPKTLRHMMNKYKVTQEELGKNIGVSRQCVSQYQNGETTPDIYTFQRIVEFFNDKFNLFYSLDYWLGATNIETGGEYGFKISLRDLGLSNEAFSTIIGFRNQPEINLINEILENVELIQLFQDYLGDEVRDDKEHLALPGVRDTIDSLFKLGEYLDFKFSPDDLYDELKIRAIIKELKKMRKKKPYKFNKHYTF